MVATKRDGAHAGYDTRHFEACLGACMLITRRERLPAGSRVLYEAEAVGAR